MKKFFSFTYLLIFLLCLLLPTRARAAEIVDSGSCGDDLTWSLDRNYTLTISGTGAMENFVLNTNENTIPWDKHRTAITEVVIEEGVTSIGDNAFINCYNLATASIADSVTVIGRNAFAGCSMLVAVKLGSGLASLKDGAFQQSGIPEIVLPAGVTEIGDHAFSECHNLTGVFIPDGVTYLGSQVFSVCYQLRYLSMPDTLTIAGSDTFLACWNLWHIFWRGEKTTHESNDIFFWLNEQVIIHHQTGTDILRFTGEESTCRYSGYMIASCQICDSGIGYAQSLKPHTYQDATCDNPRTCIACGHTVGKPLSGAHEWDEGIVIKEATKEAVGIRQYTCTICGDLKAEVVEYTADTSQTLQEMLSGETLFLIIVGSVVALILGSAALVSLKQRIG